MFEGFDNIFKIFDKTSIFSPNFQWIFDILDVLTRICSSFATRATASKNIFRKCEIISEKQSGGVYFMGFSLAVSSFANSLMCIASRTKLVLPHFVDALLGICVCFLFLSGWNRAGINRWPGGRTIL